MTTATPSLGTRLLTAAEVSEILRVPRSTSTSSLAAAAFRS